MSTDFREMLIATDNRHFEIKYHGHQAIKGVLRFLSLENLLIIFFMLFVLISRNKNIKVV